MKYLYSFLFLIITSYSFGQTVENVPELQERLAQSPPLSQKRYDLAMELFGYYRYQVKKYTINKSDPEFAKAFQAYGQEAIDWANQYGTMAQAAKAKVYYLYYYRVIDDTMSFIALARECLNTNVFETPEDEHFVYINLTSYYNLSGFYREYIELAPTQFSLGRILGKEEAQLFEEYQHIGMAHYNLKDYDKARAYFKLAIKEQKNKQRQLLQASFNNNIGLSFSNEKKVDSAQYYFNNAIRILESNNIPEENNGSQAYRNHFLNIIKSNIAYMNIDSGNYENAISSIKQEFESSITVNEIPSIIQAGNKLGKLYYYKKKYNLASNYLKRVQSYFKDYPNLFNNSKIENWEWYSKILLAQGNQDQSERVYNKMVLLKDSIASAKAMQQARIAGVIYEVDKKDLEIKTQQSNIELLVSQNKIKNQWLLFGSFGLLLSFGFVSLLRSRNTARKNQMRQEQFSRDLIQAQEHERTRVSKDLHDSVGQQLTLIKKKAQNSNYDGISELTSATLEEVRSISRGLYPSNLKQLGLTESIEQLLYDLDEETDMFFSVEIDPINAYFNEEETLNFYRFIQEAVNNVIKHSQAKTLIVVIEKSDSSIKATIKDNGIGFKDVNKLRANSLGLKTINERIQMLKGSISINSIIKKGTTISAQIPI